MFRIAQEAPQDGASIESLLDAAFGVRRQLKLSYRYRTGRAAEAPLCLTARLGPRLVGSIRYWRLLVGEVPALLLGPLAIDPERRGQGIGRALTWTSLARAEARGWRLVLLVGDLDYYAQFGFVRAPDGVVMPGEDPRRLLCKALAGAGLPPAGVLRRWREGGAGRAAVEEGQERLAHERDALVACHGLGHLAQPRGHGGGDARLPHHFRERTEEGADGEEDEARGGQAAERLALHA
jgi:predicted N-acetyltransferase YhbS